MRVSDTVCRGGACADPCAAEAAINDKFGSFSATMAIFHAAGLVGFVVSITVAFGNGWNPLYVACALLTHLTLIYNVTYDLTTPCAPPMLRAQVRPKLHMLHVTCQRAHPAALGSDMRA